MAAQTAAEAGAGDRGENKFMDYGQQVVNQGAEYVLGLKGNQSALYDAVKDFFAVAQAGEFAGVDHDFYEEID